MDSSFCWPDGSQAVSNPFTYLNFAWPDWSPDSIEQDEDEDEFFQLPADASSADRVSAIFPNHRSLSNGSPSAARQQNLNQRPLTVAETEPPPPFKKPRSSNISLSQPPHSSGSSLSDDLDLDPDPEAMAKIKEMTYQAAAFSPVSFLPEETTERPRRKNVRISSDPQTVAARRRREQVSKRIRALQKLVPGGTRMDTASMLDEAANYLKFLKAQVEELEKVSDCGSGQIVFSPVPFSLNSYMQNYYNLDHAPV